MAGARMIARKLLASGLIFFTFLAFAGCETVIKLTKIDKLERGYLYFVEAKGSSDIGAILYRNENANTNDEIVVIATGVTRAFWQEFILALTGAASNVGAAAVYGISIPKMRSTVSAVAGGSTTTATGTGGSNTNTSTNTNTNQSCSSGDDVDDSCTSK